MIKNNVRNKTMLVVCISLLVLLGLLFTDGQYWILSCLALWLILFVFIFLILRFIIYDVFLPLFNKKLERLTKTKVFIRYSSKDHSSKSFSESNKILYKLVLPFLISVLIVTPYLTVHMTVLTQWKSDQNISECTRIAFQSIDSAFTNASKAKEILVYFDEGHGNIYNAYRMKDHYLFSIDRGMLEFYSTYPYIAVRTYGDDHPCWILTSQFGHCGEYANLYRYLCDQIGLRVRKVCTDGENHCWNEVFINDTTGWKLVDATTVSVSDGKNGFDNVNRTWMKHKLGGNLSHVVAQELDAEYVDITREYTTVVNVTVKTITTQGSLVSDACVKVVSNNRYEDGRYTNVEGSTDTNGEYRFSIGIGNYTFNVQKNELTGMNSSIVSRDNQVISVYMQ